MDVAELIARESIRATIARYTFAGDRGRLEALAGCFTDDGVLELVDGWTARGRGEILSHTGSSVPDSQSARVDPILRHHLSSQRIEVVSGEEARAWTYFIAATEIGPDHAGRYIDRLCCVGAEWLIDHRRVVVEWYAPNTVYAQYASRRPHKRRAT